MTTTLNATICYSENDTLYPHGYSYEDSLKEVLEAWADEGVPGTHPGNTGGFFTNDMPSGFSGDTYGFTTGNGYAISVYGSITYDFPTHVLSGTVDAISFGGGLDLVGNVVDPFLTINFDDPLVSAIGDTGQYSVHDVIWGLMNSSLEGYPSGLHGTPGYGGLFAVLEDIYGIDIENTAIEDLPNAVACDSELLGIPEFDEYLLAA